MPKRSAKERNAAKPRTDQKPRPSKPRPSKPPPAPEFGPGTELKEIFASLGVKSDGCGGCESTLEKMNRLGVQGCQEHRDSIIANIRERATTVMRGVKKLMAAWNAVTTGLAFVVNPLDPLPGLFDEALKRASEKEHPNGE